MNYTSLLVGFRNYRRKAPIGKNAILLYFILWEYVNEYRLPTEGFTATNSVLQANSGLSRRDLDSARNELKLNGYIGYKKGTGNQCGTYLIVSFDTQTDTQFDTHNDTQTDTQFDTQMHHINKQNKTKLNKTKDNKKTKDKKDFVLSDFLSTLEISGELINSITGFAEHRETIKKPLTERALKIIFSDFDKWGYDENQRIECVNLSIKNGWTGVFPLKEQQNSNIPQAGATQRQQYKTAYERTLDTAREGIEKYYNGELDIIDI